MTEEYIKITKFANKIKDIIKNEKFKLLDNEFDTIYTEFETALYKSIPLDKFEDYKKLMISGVEMLLSEVKNFKKPIIPISKNIIINMKDAIDDTIKELQGDAEIFRNLEE